MKEINRIAEALEAFSKGLYSAQVGDIVNIGVQGEREKRTAEVEKILQNGDLVVTGGHVFSREGFLKKAISGSWPWLPSAKARKEKIVYASLVTQEELDELYVSSALSVIKREIDRLEFTREQVDQLLETLGKIKGTRFHIGGGKSRFSRGKVS